MLAIQRVSVFTLLLFIICSSCTKSETILVSDNDPPIVNNVPAIKIENYVNRVFIDLLGREPLDAEMEVEVQHLRDGMLSKSTRLALLEKLQTSTDFVEGDTSYQRAYHQQFYNLAKVRFLEGVSDQAIVEEFIPNADSIETLQLLKLIDSRADLQFGNIQLSEFFGRMIHNNVYDQINMNTFNFVNATFDNLYWRYPTNAEFQSGFQMVENQTEQNFLGQSGSDKFDYVAIITTNLEFFEGLIIWVYQQLLSRRPDSAETAALLNDLATDQDIRVVQRLVMSTDEYAGF
ncbi:MAG: hypothetical protein KDC34_11500 [Saprospiraceae bacterium]|nr:hypothetical protein [Saprospiraceae bacterium]